MDVMTEETPKTKPTGAHVATDLDEPVIHLRDERIPEYTECGIMASRVTSAERMATCPKCINWRIATLEHHARAMKAIMQ